MGKIRNAYKILVRTYIWKRPLQRPSCRWGDNIKMGVREIGWEVEDWLCLAQDKDEWWALVSMVMNIWVL
jgi:hypothetical protein